MHVTFTWGHSLGQNSGSGHNPNPLSTIWALGGGEGSQDGVPGTPTYIPQKGSPRPTDHFEHTFVGVFEKKVPHAGARSEQPRWGGGVEVRKILLPSARQLEEGRDTRLETSKCH